MNVIAPVFANENAAFASANQDLILRAMQRATPPSMRNYGWQNGDAKGAPGIRQGSLPHRVLNEMAGGDTYTIQQLSERTKLAGEKVSNAIRDLRRGGHVTCINRYEGKFNGYRRVAS